MRGLGFGALGIAVLSLVFWLIGWTLFNFVMPSIGTVPRALATGCDFLGKFGTFVAAILLAVGLIVGGKKPAAPPAI